MTDIHVFRVTCNGYYKEAAVGDLSEYITLEVGKEGQHCFYDEACHLESWCIERGFQLQSALIVLDLNPVFARATPSLNIVEKIEV